MKIQEMVEWLEGRGFNVQKSYDSKGRYYRFLIDRNGISFVDIYLYVPGLKGKALSAHQFNFLNNIVNTYEKLEKEQHKWIGHCLSQGFKDGIEEKERKTEMNNKFYPKNDLIMARYSRVIQEAGAKGEKATLEVGGERMPILLNSITCRGGMFENEQLHFEAEVLVPDKEFEEKEYCKFDVESLYPKIMIKTLGRRNGKEQLQLEIYRKMLGLKEPFTIEKVIFNDPATIVIWADGTKTVVKTQNGEEYDPEKGLAMAITKKALGNKREYYHTVKHWVKKYDKQTKEQTAFEKFAEELREFGKKFGE